MSLSMLLVSRSDIINADESICCGCGWRPIDAMMAMVQMGNQTGFDMLWRWVKLHMQHLDRSDPQFGWSAWHCFPNGTAISEGPAPVRLL
jgi:hypothetical protein